MTTKLLIVGYSGETHVGTHFRNAAIQLGISCKLVDAYYAYNAHQILIRMNWRLRGRRPTFLNTFSKLVVEECQIFKPDYVIVTGITPPNAQALRTIHLMGIPCVNYLTDDPWNTAHYSSWFSEAQFLYSMIFSPRESNLGDIRHLGVKAVYLPFAYAPEVHYPQSPPDDLQAQYICDVLFYGGADRDRLPYIRQLIDAGLNVHLYGGYWNRFAETRLAAKGVANAQTLRWAVSKAKITLCLVRQANRDGHVMRTYEAPAMGACMLTEETEEHKRILGDEGESVVYFSSTNMLIEKAKQLLKNDQQRLSLIQKARQKITGSPNTYLDRLKTMLEYV